MNINSAEKQENNQINLFLIQTYWQYLSNVFFISTDLLFKGLLNLLQHHSLKASILQYSVFFMVQLLHPHMTSGKTIALTITTFDRKVMPLLFIMLSMVVIDFLPRSRCLLISWMQSPSGDFGAQENNVWHCFHCFAIYSPWSDGTRCHDLSFLNVEL